MDEATVDATAAVVALLSSEAAVTTLAGADRVFGTELPDDDPLVALMPAYAVIVQPAGGPGDAGYLRLGRQRLDVNSYASSPFLARKLARLVHHILKPLRRRVVSYTDDDGQSIRVLLHSIEPSGGFTAVREPTTRWPRVISTYLVTYAEQEVPA